MDTPVRSGVFSFAQAQTHIPGPDGVRNALVLNRGTLDVRLVLPTPPNRNKKLDKGN